MACTLLEILLETREGYEYLAEDQMLRQIAESLFQIDTVGLRRRCGSAIFSALLTNSPVSGTYCVGGRERVLGSPRRTNSHSRLLQTARGSQSDGEGVEVRQLATFTKGGRLLTPLSCANSSRLLDQARMFTAIHRIAELRNRDDLVVLVIQSLDYTLSARACFSPLSQGRC